MPSAMTHARRTRLLNTVTISLLRATAHCKSGFPWRTLFDFLIGSNYPLVSTAENILATSAYSAGAQCHLLQSPQAEFRLSNILCYRVLPPGVKAPCRGESCLTDCRSARI